MSGRVAHLPLLFGILFTGAAPGASGEALPTAVMSSDSAPYRQALEGFSEAWGPGISSVSAEAPLPRGARAFVALGSKAAGRRWPADAVVVACLAPSAESVEGDAVTRVSLLPDPGVLVQRLRALAPKLKVLRVFWSAGSSREEVEALAAAGEKAGLVVLPERISPPSTLPERLRRLDRGADALWLMPDPELVTAESFAVLREYAAALKIPFIAPTEGLAERGATATIAVSFRDMGRAAAQALRARLEGRAVPEVKRAARVTVTVNAAAAISAGLGPKFESADTVLP